MTKPTNSSRYCTKGSHIIVVQEWIDAKLGDGAFKALATEANAPKEWFVPLLSASWYDVDVLMPIINRASERSGVNLLEMTTDFARQNALKDLRGIYSAFLRILNPLNLLRFTPQLWRNYVDFAEAKAITNERGYYLGECTGFEPRHIEWVCGDWLGFIPTGIELAGGKITSARITERVATGGGRIRLEVKYEMKAA